MEQGKLQRTTNHCLIGLAVWTVYGAFSASLTHYRFSFSHKPLTWPQAFFVECSYAYAAGLLSPVVFLLAKRFPLRHPQLARNVAIHLAGTFLYSCVISLLWDRINLRGAFARGQFSFIQLFQSWDWGIDFGVLLYWLLVLFQHALDSHRRYQASLIHAANLHAQLARAQLHALKMQLHPHFLFNTLHAISELIYEDPPAAERMIIGLSQLLRLSLDTSFVLEVPLSQELHFVELYLEIERARFESRLDVSLDIEGCLRNALVPNLILQPLVENSIKHGIAKRSEGGAIMISARDDSGTLVLSVRDNGCGMEPQPDLPLREGVGLGTTRARLEKLYGARGTLYFLRRPNTGVEVTIRLPLKLQQVQEAEELILS